MPGLRRVRAAALGGALFALATAGCGGDDEPGQELGPDEWRASVYESVLRDVAFDEAHDNMPEDDRPAVYLATADGSDISLDVQVIVVNAVKDDASLEFVDVASDVVLADEPGKPVKGDGLLLTVGPLPEEPVNRVEVTVGLYVSELDDRTVDVTLTRAADTWAVTTSIPA